MRGERAATSVLAWVVAVNAAAGASVARDLNYIPPDLERSVVFYHSFEDGITTPELDAVGAKLKSPKKLADDGLTGRAMKIHSREEAKSEFQVRTDALSIHRNVTVSMWWRLDEELKAESCYALMALRGKGYISSFVRGKGGWCALKRPTFVFQCYNFPDVSNANNVWTGSAWVKPGEWHHLAMTVSLGSEVCVYWDGALRVRHSIKGRAFRADDKVSTAAFGPTWLYHPMTIDDIMICNRALTADEIKDYVEAVKRLHEIDFPVRDARKDDR